MDQISHHVLSVLGLLIITIAAHWGAISLLRRRRKGMAAALRQRDREFTLIYEAGHDLSSTLDLDQIYSTIYRFVSGIMPCESLYVSSYDPADRLIRRLYAWGNGNRIDVSQVPPIPLEAEGLGTQRLVIRTGEPLLLPDYEAQRRTANSRLYLDEDSGQVVDPSEVPEDAERPRSAIVVPLKSRGQVIGVIQVFSCKLAAFSDNDLRLLKSLAVYVSAALTNAFLYQQAQTEIAERKQVETALRESEEKFRTFIEQSSDGITLIDEQGFVIEWIRPA